jgi:hypothetical protein
LRGSILRSAIDIDNHRSFAREAFENAGLNGVENGLNGSGIVTGRKAYQNVDLAHRDELAKKIIGQKSFFRQNVSLKTSEQAWSTAMQCQMRRSRNQ